MISIQEIHKKVSGKWQGSFPKIKWQAQAAEARMFWNHFLQDPWRLWRDQRKEYPDQCRVKCWHLVQLGFLSLKLQNYFQQLKKKILTVWSFFFCSWKSWTLKKAFSSDTYNNKRYKISGNQASVFKENFLFFTWVDSQFFVVSRISFFILWKKRG